MVESKSRVSDLTIQELELFNLAARTPSFREIARQTDMLPAHVSKIMKKIETKLDMQLFKRSATGFLLTPDALEILDRIEQICEISETFKTNKANVGRIESPMWTIGSISFLTTYLLAPAIGELRKTDKKKSRYRLIEFTHNDLVAHGLKGAFEIAVHIEELEWTQVWESVPLGKLSWRLYGRRGHPLGNSCDEQSVLQFPFVVPTDWSLNRYAIGDDNCPLSVRRRQKGDEAATAETALELCRTTNQLTFIPEILARSWCEKHDLTEISVQSWKPVEKDIYLTVKTDVVPRWLRDGLVKIFLNSSSFAAP